MGTSQKLEQLLLSLLIRYQLFTQVKLTKETIMSLA